MKPDFDDFDDYANENDTPRSRAMSWLVLAVALSGFVALAWYAYHSGSESVQEGQMVVIKADDSPLKERPAVAGGEEFPHQDKTIYDTISPYRAKEEAKVEKLLPEAEEPVVEEASKESETRTWVNDKLRSVSDAEEKINEQLETAKPVAKEETKKIVANEVVKKPIAPKEEVAKMIPAPAAKPEDVTKQVAAPVTKVEASKESTKAEPMKEAPKTQPVTSGSGYKIQLGAFKSQAEAEQNWARISSKHAGVLSGYAHLIVKAELPNGTYYRLRVSGYDTADNAKLACAKLSAAGQPCFFAGK